MTYEYQLKTLKNLDKLPVNTWYPFESKNHVAEELLEVVKLRIQLSGDYVISNDYKLFKRIEIPPPKEQIPRGIEIKLEWHPNSYELNEKERNLPDPVFRNLTKKEKEHYQSRRTDT